MPAIETLLRYGKLICFNSHTGNIISLHKDMKNIYNNQQAVAYSYGIIARVTFTAYFLY